MIIIEKKEPLIAIQTIRNLIMTGTFLISLNMILLGGIGSVISLNETLLKSAVIINEIGFVELMQTLGDHTNLFKLFTSVFMLLYSAYNFTIMVRILYNMNFTIPAAIYKDNGIDFQLEQTRRQSKHFNKGIRALLFSVGPLLWLLNNVVFIVFSFVITLLFYMFDFNIHRK